MPSPACLLAASFLFAAACGTSSVPQTSGEVVGGLVSALVEGDKAKLGAMMLNKDDVEELIDNAGDELSEKKATRAREGVKKNAERLDKAWSALTDGAKTAGIDLKKLTAGDISETSEVSRGTTSVRITSTLNDGEREHELVMKAMKTSRGLVLSRPPRVMWRSASGPAGAIDAVFKHHKALLDVVDANKDDAQAADAAVDAYLKANGQALDNAKSGLRTLLEDTKANDPEAMMRIMQAGAQKMSTLARQQSALEAKSELRDVLKKIEMAVQ